MSGEKKFPVVEIFGPTIQGEGALAGKPTLFVRFGGCDYKCAWCDSAYAVLPEEVRKAERLTWQEIMERIRTLNVAPEWVTLSGGNPALHDLEQLVEDLHAAKFKVAVETQGTLWKEWLRKVDLLTISPKPPSSGMSHPEDLRNFLAYEVRHDPNQHTVWSDLYRHICLKIPVLDEQDYLYAVEVHLEYPRLPFYLSVVTLMGGLDGKFQGGQIDDSADLLGRYRVIAERTAADPLMADVTVIPQLHVLTWGHGRGF